VKGHCGGRVGRLEKGLNVRDASNFAAWRSTNTGTFPRSTSEDAAESRLPIIREDSGAGVWQPSYPPGRPGAKPCATRGGATAPVASRRGLVGPPLARGWRRRDSGCTRPGQEHAAAAASRGQGAAELRSYTSRDARKRTAQRSIDAGTAAGPSTQRAPRAEIQRTDPQ